MSSVVSVSSLFGTLSVTLLVLSACAHGTSSSNGDGGSDDISGPSVTLANATVGGTQSTGTTLGGQCDSGVLGSVLANSTAAQQATCNACITCTKTGMCATQYDTLEAEPSTNEYLTCLQNCADGDTTCTDGCSAAYPTADTYYLDFLSCGICQDCVQNCDAADSCM